MRARDFITESEGGMARRAEEAQRGKRVAFRNQDGNIISILGAEVFPQDKDLADDYEQINQEVIDFLGQNGVPISNASVFPGTSGFIDPNVNPDKAKAALVMIFQDESSNKKLAWIAYKTAKKGGAYPIFVQTKLFTTLTGYVQLSGKKGEEDKVAGVQQRALTNLKPVGILPSNTEISVSDIPAQVNSFIQNREDLSDDIKSQVVQLLEAVADGTSVPVPGAGDYAKSYEIDLGETAAPIALAAGKFVSGSYQQAQDGLNVNFSEVRGVEFPDDPAEKLYDSYLIIDDNQLVRVSSKDKSGGAKASVSGVVDDIERFPERYEGLFDEAKNPGFKDMLDIVQIIKSPDMNLVAGSTFKRNGAIAGALQLGIKTGIITESQAGQIMEIIDNDVHSMSTKELGDLASVLKHKGTDDNTRPDYRIGWHLLAAVANGAAQKVNSQYKVDSFFKAILERSNMIQVKTTLKQAKTTDAEGRESNGAYFSNFAVIYPPVFTGSISLDSSSNFYATRRPVGKMGFSIK